MYDCDVAIVGLGPVGATLANLLGQAGVAVTVFERESAVYPLPRAVHFDDEVMRVFQTIGITDSLLKKIRVNPGMRFVDKDHMLLLDWPRPNKISAQGWHPSYRFHQPDLESILRESIAGLVSVDVRLNTDVRRIEQDDNSCTIQFRNTVSDIAQDQHITARYVVGCDGANSIVRNSIDSEVIDFGFHERWLVVDVTLDTEKPELGDYTIQYCDPDRPHTYVRGPFNRRRWEIALHDHEAAASMLEEGTVWSLLSPWLTPAEATLERRAVYTFQSAMAAQWRAGRVFLAGDAAHQTPPFMGQGMCGGIRDAANLAWKLQSCIQQGHADRLLDSYQQERAPHMETYIKATMMLGGLINACGTEDALRSALLNPDGTSKMKSLSLSLGNGIAAGHKAHRGVLFPQPVTVSGELLDDVVGYLPVLVIAESLLQNISAKTTVWPALSIMNARDIPALEALLDDYNVNAVLIRPDRYVLGTAITESELADLLDFHPMDSAVG